MVGVGGVGGGLMMVNHMAFKGANTTEKQHVTNLHDCMHVRTW